MLVSLLGLGHSTTPAATTRARESRERATGSATSGKGTAPAATAQAREARSAAFGRDTAPTTSRGRTTPTKTAQTLAN